MAQNQLILICREPEIKDVLSSRRYSSYELIGSQVSNRCGLGSENLSNSQRNPKNALYYRRSVPYSKASSDISKIAPQAFTFSVQDLAKSEIQKIDQQQYHLPLRSPQHPQKDLKNYMDTEEMQSVQSREYCCQSSTQKKKNSFSKKARKLILEALSFRRTTPTKTKIFCESTETLVCCDKSSKEKSLLFSKEHNEKTKKAFGFRQLINKWRIQDKNISVEHIKAAIIGGMTGDDIVHVKNMLVSLNYYYAWSDFLTLEMAKELAEIQKQTNKKSKVLNQYRMGQQIVILRLCNAITANLSFLSAVNANIKTTTPTLDCVSNQIKELEMAHFPPQKVFASSIMDTSSITRKSRYLSMLINNPSAITKKGPYFSSKSAGSSRITLLGRKETTKLDNKCFRTPKKHFLYKK